MARWISPAPSGGSAESSREHRVPDSHEPGARLTAALEPGLQQMAAWQQLPGPVQSRQPVRINA